MLITKMLGLDGIDLEALGKRLIESIESHERNELLILDSLQRIEKHLDIEPQVEKPALQIVGGQ
jgi:hypothetical protein